MPSLGNKGKISPHGQALIDDFDREFAQEQQRAPVQQTFHVVDDWGLDPSGQASINNKFEAEVSGLSNAKVVFPKGGTFALSGSLRIAPSGPIRIIGNGSSLVVPSGDHNCRAIDAPALESGSLISGLTVDMTGDDLRAETRIGTEGTVRVDNVRMKGYLPPLPRDSTEIDAILTAMARTESSKIQFRNFVAIGGTAADMHSENPQSRPNAPENNRGTPIGLWVGQSSVGTVQMVDCQLRGWQNGTYTGRTMAIVQFLRGWYGNNSNSQIRGSGGTLIDGVTFLLDDRRWSKKKNPGPYSLGENQGVYAIRVDPGGNKGNQRDPIVIRNALVKGLSMEQLSALMDWEGSAGPGIVQNTKVINHIDVPTILGEAPGSQFNYPPTPQTNIMVENSLITGPSTKIAEVIDRPQSRIQRTCIAVLGAEAEDISGMQIGPAVSFGKQCSGQAGLSNPKKVGSGGKLSQLPVPSNSGSFSGVGRGGGGGWGGKLLAGLIAIPLANIAMVFIPIFIGLLLLGVVTFGLLLLYLKKLGG